jgi:DNA polymerase III delta prime subunit
MHHAYLYQGSLSLLRTLAQDARERFGFMGEHNPDVQVREYEKFGIEEARELQTAASMRSSSGRALYIVGVSQLTTEAQQALLKLFEEPQAGAIFVLLAPHGSVIATLRSRLLEYPNKLKEIAAQKEPKGKVSQKVLGSPSGSAQPDHFAQLFLSALLQDA